MESLLEKPIIDVEQLVSPESDPVLVWEATVAKAIACRVSDIHLLCHTDGCDLYYRIDGDMRRQGTIGHEMAKRIISHVKAQSGIDLTENRRPTEGRALVKDSGHTVDLRVSTVPTIHGQDMVVRMFDRTISLMDIDQLGMHDEQLTHVHDLITRPHGLVLVCGPTGSGKTTTLYAMLRQMCGKGRKIMTIEDPVEYDLAGVNQTQVNPKLGVNFAMLLTAILRQDPDVIMVGEIRDEETAITAVRAANAGNLVLATTHATRASRAVETMLGLGAHPYFLAVALQGVISQTLVKRVCPHCKAPVTDTADMIVDEPLLQRLNQHRMTPRLYQGVGCGNCYGSGYQGRMALFEVFSPNDAIKQMILDRRPADEIDNAAAANGKMLTLEQSGKLAAFSGKTTIEEIVSALPSV